MSETSAPTPATPAVATPKKKGAKAGAKKPKAAPSHPKVSEMVNSAITSLKERGGSSLQAIKKHIGAHYKVDVDKLSPFIKKYLKSAVAGGTLVQTKGKGATGSFKLSASGQKVKESGAAKQAKKTKKEGSSAAKKPKAAAAKKSSKPKPKAEKKKATSVKKAAVKKSAPKAKSPKKAAAKPSKPKAAKPKKAKATPKKAAAKKSSKK